jgi:hypothetical protein
VKDPASTTAAPPLRHSSTQGQAPAGQATGTAGTRRRAGQPVSGGRRLLAVADALPVTVLAAIAGAGSFTHIRDTAARHGQHGPMAWAVAIRTDLTCVMAARERQRDKRLAIATRRLSWPTTVLAGGIGLSLAANLAQAQPTAWGQVAAATPCAAFLVAVSMIERRATRPAARRPRPGRGRLPAVPARTAIPRRRGRPGRRPADRGTPRRRQLRGRPQPAHYPRHTARPARHLHTGRLRPAARAPRQPRAGPPRHSRPHRPRPDRDHHRAALTRRPPPAGRDGHGCRTSLAGRAVLGPGRAGRPRPRPSRQAPLVSSSWPHGRETFGGEL